MIKFLKKTLKSFINLCSDVTMTIKSFYYKKKAIKLGICGMGFDNFGRSLGWTIIKRGNYSIGKQLLMNPINIVRYFEFQFAYDSNDWIQLENILDVSSPRIFCLYITANHPKIKYTYINPDTKDTYETQEILDASGHHPENLTIRNEDATQLNYPNNSFNSVVSISVIEHIPNDGDMKALQEMWRIIAPGGKLIITIPYSPNYIEEYFDFNQYGLYPANSKGEFFGSRYYDIESLHLRVFNSLGKNPSLVKILGEIKPGTFFNYRKRQWRKGIKESIKDPYYIATEYKIFQSLHDVPGLAVVGLVFEKK